MTFAEINEQLVQAQQALEDKLREVREASQARADADVELIRRKQALEDSKSFVRAYQSRVDSLREIAWNLRKEAGIR